MIVQPPQTHINGKKFYIPNDIQSTEFIVSGCTSHVKRKMFSTRRPFPRPIMVETVPAGKSQKTPGIGTVDVRGTACYTVQYAGQGNEKVSALDADRRGSKTYARRETS